MLVRGRGNKFWEIEYAVWMRMYSFALQLGTMGKEHWEKTSASLADRLRMEIREVLVTFRLWLWKSLSALRVGQQLPVRSQAFPQQPHSTPTFLPLLRAAPWWSSI